MGNMREKVISILAGNLNSGRSYHIKTVKSSEKVEPYQWLADNAATTRSMSEKCQKQVGGNYECLKEFLFLLELYSLKYE